MLDSKATFEAYVSDKDRFEWSMLDTISLAGLMQRKKKEERELNDSRWTNSDDAVKLRKVRYQLKFLKSLIKSRQMKLL
jgi:hypothetical protein